MTPNQTTALRPLDAYGAGALCVRNLRTDSLADVFEYADLRRDESPLVDEVLECENRPLLYVLRSESLTAPASPDKQKLDINSLCRQLASRGEAAYLGVLEPGRLSIWPCLLENAQKFEATVLKGDSSAPSLLSDLSQGIAHGDLERARKKLLKEKLREKMLETLRDAGKRIYGSAALAKRPKGERSRLTLALVGRTLFTRFLLDRKLVSKDHVPGIDYTRWFADHSATAKLCAWLDQTFNGELLPILDIDGANLSADSLEAGYKNFFASLFRNDPPISCALYDLFLGSKNSDQYKLIKLLDFSHIPVGLLSEAYEDFAHHFDGENAKKTSVHFTPRHIVDAMINQAFEGLPKPERPTAKVLDPAAGAGIFLTMAFRKLAKERLQAGLPLETDNIRTLLYDQLRGMDINPHALSLASLSLYLTAIEIDPAPEPVTKLRFERRLIGNVLFDVGGGKDGLGSLSSAAPREFDGKFDIVIGNPPWTSKPKDTPLRKATREIARRIIEARLGEQGLADATINALQKIIEADDRRKIEFTPDYNPDISFLWRSMEWAKPRGILAFTIHARFLFKITKHAINARTALFRVLRVTGVVNCADLRQTNVWPEVDAHFCIFFARNETPSPQDGFRFLSPYREGVSRQGRIRLDPSRCHTIAFDELRYHPTMLKTLFRGTSLDMGIIEKIINGAGRNVIELKDYWRNELKLTIGEGYIVGKTKKKISALHLGKLNAKHLDRARVWRRGKIDIESLHDYNTDYFPEMACPYSIERYKSPLLLLWKSFNGKSGKDLGLHMGNQNIIYTERYLGFSAAEHPQGRDILKYIFIVLRSSLARYFFLMIGSGYGAERESLNLDDIYRLPIIPFENLRSEERNQASSLLDRYWDENIEESETLRTINDFVCSLYGLSEYDQATMTDSVELFQDRAAAENPPHDALLSRFADSINEDVKELFELYGLKPLAQADVLESPLEAWRFIEIRRHGLARFTKDQTRLKFFANYADKEGASEVVFSPEDGRLIIGRLAQKRYWTGSQARLCGRMVLERLVKDKKPWGLTATDGASKPS